MTAKKELKRFLDNRFIQGALYVEERHPKSEGIHYHLLLFFYESRLPFPAPKMFEEMQRTIFSAWNRQNGGGLNPEGNKMREHTPNYVTLDYLMPRRGGELPNGETKWWGCRNKNLLVKKASPPTRKEVREAMSQLFPRDRLPFGLHFTMRGLARLKKVITEVSLLANPLDEWEDYKREETGRTDTVTDKEFLDFKKGLQTKWRTEAIAAREKSLRVNPHAKWLL